MNIITRYPVYVDHKMINQPDFYVLAEGAKKVVKKKNTGKFGKAAKGIFDKVKETGIVDAATDRLRDSIAGKRGASPSPGPESAPPSDQGEPKKKEGMSMGAKIGIAIGIGLIATAFFYSRRKKTK